jgi:hypothetical protein
MPGSIQNIQGRQGLKALFWKRQETKLIIM